MVDIYDSTFENYENSVGIAGVDIDSVKIVSLRRLKFENMKAELDVCLHLA